MKKFISLVLLVLFVVNLAACSDAGYRYADSWNVENAQSVDAMVSIKKHIKPDASKYDAVLKDAKKLIKESISYPELLDWEKFDQLQTVKELDFNNITTDMPYEDAYIISSYFAFYDEDTDCCYILPQFYTADAEKRLYVLMHEVTHSLVDNRDDMDDYQIVEGAVDWLASMVCTELGLSIVPSYQESIICLRVLMDIYGKDRILRAICEDNVVDLIDGSTKPGMTEKLSNALSIAHTTSSSVEDVRKAVYAELDILAHAAKQEDIDISDWFDYIADVYEGVGIKIDVRYFKRI